MEEAVMALMQDKNDTRGLLKPSNAGNKVNGAPCKLLCYGPGMSSEDQYQVLVTC